jgi:WD40 repeat protein
VYLISGSRDAQLKIWDTSRAYELYKTIPAHMFAINDIKYHPERNFLATASMDKTIKVWDATNFQLLKVIDKARHNSHITSVNKLYWSSYENQLISCSDDRTILVWALKFKDHSE